MKKAFSIVELMIVVAILGILAAIVIPRFEDYSTEAKTAAAKNNLQVLRAAIELYATRHNGIPPGYPGDYPDAAPSPKAFIGQLTYNAAYLLKMPQNPFTGLATVLTVDNNSDFPAAATGQYGWVYQPNTKTIRLDWPGKDPEGVAYFDY